LRHFVERRPALGDNGLIAYAVEICRKYLARFRFWLSWISLKVWFYVFDLLRLSFM